MERAFLNAQRHKRYESEGMAAEEDAGMLRLDIRCRVMQIKEEHFGGDLWRGPHREKKGREFYRQSEQLRSRNRREIVQEEKGKRNRTYGDAGRTSEGGTMRGRGRESPGGPIVSDAFTVVMMHRAAGPLLSLKLYEASLAHILLQ